MTFEYAMSNRCHIPHHHPRHTFCGEMDQVYTTKDLRVIEHRVNPHMPSSVELTCILTETLHAGKTTKFPYTLLWVLDDPQWQTERKEEGFG